MLSWACRWANDLSSWGFVAMNLMEMVGWMDSIETRFFQREEEASGSLEPRLPNPSQPWTTVI